jgi:hydrogenase maturation protein HypF
LQAANKIYLILRFHFSVSSVFSVANKRIFNGPLCAEQIRVCGIVQGVGFRPMVWRLAKELGITGNVCNDGEGVLIHAWASLSALDIFIDRLQAEPPPLARIDSLDRSSFFEELTPDEFQIISSETGKNTTGVVADAATCPDCLAEVLDPNNRRYRYPFTNCTNCGPRLSIVKAIPYDRANTSMQDFKMCAACQQEYDDPADRRFHAQPNACAECGPQFSLVDENGVAIAHDGDVIDATCELIKQGSIVAVKGIGGFHLACDAMNDAAVNKLRKRKRRYHKPFALMTSNIEMIKSYANVNDLEERLLNDKTAPVVVLTAKENSLSDEIAPGQYTLGFMLPYSPLHHLLIKDMQQPLVMTSGNSSDEPQCIDNQAALDQLKGIADYWLLHDRDIVNRLDDSVIRLMDNKPRFFRRARGFAPESILLPEGFEQAPAILAMGAELKNTFCLTKGNEAILSQHIGDLEDVAAIVDYRHQLQLYRQLFEHKPQIIAVDKHPDYLSTKLGKELASEDTLSIEEIQHHHAHIASCMAEHGLPLNTKTVLGVAMDGLGFGEDGTIWGGEFLLADYTSFKRVAALQAVPMPGGIKAILEPWRNTYAHLSQNPDWQTVKDQYSQLDIIRYLEDKPLKNLNTMIAKGLNSPLASSCGRLFDAVAAAINVCRDEVSHEGQAAMQLEALATEVWQQEQDHAYPFHLNNDQEMPVLNWQALWHALLDDLQQDTDYNIIAARFHHGLAKAIAEVAQDLCKQNDIETVVLNGGVFQNRLLLEGVTERLEETNLNVLSPSRLPANDGGLAYGQAVIAAARALQCG